MFDDELEFEEWNGVVLSAGPPGVIECLQAVRERDGHLVIWEYQRFRHHEHPDFRAAEDAVVDEQEAARRKLGRVLAAKYPALCFVVETDWLDRTTWYQPFSGAAVADEEFQPQFPVSTVDLTGLSGLREVVATEIARRIEASRDSTSARMCARCAKSDWSEPYEMPESRGVRWIRCSGCGARVIEATRTTRDLIGEPGVGSQPEVP